MVKKIQDTKSELYQVADLIHSTEKINRIRLFLLTNAIAPANYEKETAELEEGTSCEYIIWDAKRVMRQNNIISGKDYFVVFLGLQKYSKLQSQYSFIMAAAA